MLDIVLATGNPGKVKEMAELLSDLPMTFTPQSAYHVPSAEETGSTFIENATIKATHAASLTGRPALADDSGLAIEALNGAPGIHSARYAGEHATDQDRIMKVLTQMQNIPEGARTAHFHCALVMVFPDRPDQALTCEGRWSGTILTAAQGTHGFGYDPIFYVPEERCSAAELDSTYKNKISHRGRAMRQLRKALQAYLLELS